MADHGPQITAARLYRRRSASGNDYFAGRRGVCKIAVLKSHQTERTSGRPRVLWRLWSACAPAEKAEYPN